VRQARGQKDLRSGTRDEIGSPCGERGVSASSRSVHHGDSARDRQGGRVGTWSSAASWIFRGDENGTEIARARAWW